MSDSLSAQLLREINDRIRHESVEEEEEEELSSIGEIEVRYIMIPGRREGSSLVWAFEEQNLYYKNYYSRSNEQQACKCLQPGCNARLYIRANGDAYRYIDIDHAEFHGSMYAEYKYMYCFNKMKEKAKIASASTTTSSIYKEVFLE